MESSTLKTLTLLKEALAADPRSLALKQVEKDLEGSEEIRLLSNKAKEAMEELAYAQGHYGPNSPLSKDKQRELYLAKKALDEHPLSREYSKRYAIIRSLYGEIDALLIGPYREKRVCLERKKQE